ncbi:MAG: hypothetical protein P4L82_05110 [Ancalomicrobiaceae bacterium]|nr:hypothetical protein [Ancalomicrobiaceae bacterium]
MSSMIVHDIRLEGSTPLNYNYVMRVSEHHSIDMVIATVAMYGAHQPLDVLHIFCHGYEADWDLRDQLCTGVEVGGFGLELCKEGLSLANVFRTDRWDRKVKKIVVFSCAAAGTGVGNDGTPADGRQFMGEIARRSGAEVIGSSATQYFNRVRAAYSGHRTVDNTIDFGAWEPPVFSFTRAVPNGRPINPGNYDMASPSRM